MVDDDLYPAPVAVPRGQGRLMVAIGLLAFVLGAVLVGWLGWSGRMSGLRDMVDPSSPPSAAASLAAPAQPTPLPEAPPLTIAQGGFDQRLAALEQRLNQLDLRAEASSGNVARAEGLLIAFAARRVVERGTALGDLEGQLKLRFADAQPRAVDAIVDAGKHPVTTDTLAGQLDALAPQLSGASDSGWARFRRETDALFTVRRDGMPSPRAVDRLERARQFLRSGQFDEAASEIARLPDAAVASDWIATVRRYAAAERGLDLIETAALIDPTVPTLPAALPPSGRAG